MIDMPCTPEHCRQALLSRLAEPSPGRIQLLTGPRQVGKTTLLLQIAEKFGAQAVYAAGMPAQIVSLQKLQGQLLDKGALETIAHYLALLQDAYLIAPLERYSGGAHRRRAAPPKLIALNNALISAMHPQGAPDALQEPERFGRWVENACLAAAINQGQRVTYWREEPYEIDAVLEGSWGNWAIEIKTGKFAASELQGLLEFTRRHAKFKPLVITTPGDESRPLALRIPGMNWQEFLLSGPPPVKV